MHDPHRTRGLLARGACAASCIGLAALCLAASLQKLWSADTWTLLSIGRWLVEHRAWPTVEEWTWSGAGHAWIELRWLFCIPMFLLFERVGDWAPSIAGAALVGTAFGAIALERRRTLSSPIAIAVLGLGLFAGVTRWVVRPELATYMMTGAFLAILGRSADGGARRARWSLIPLQIAWTNAHGMFVFGPVLTWVFAGAASLRWVACRGGTGKHAGVMLGLAAAVTAACLANPYGWRGAVMPWTLLQETASTLKLHIDELRPLWMIAPRDWRPDTIAMVVLLVVAAVSLARRPRLEPLILLVMAVYLAAGPVRNAGIVSVLAMWCALRCRPPGERAEQVPLIRIGGHLTVAALCLAAAWWLATDRYWRAVGSSRRWGAGVVPGLTAAGAADYLSQRGVRGRLYNGFGDGGYLIWRRVVPVYVDGRTEVHDAAFWDEYFGPKSENWIDWAQREGVSTVMVPRHGYEWLAEGLAQIPTWERVYEDDRSVVYVRRESSPDVR